MTDQSKSIADNLSEIKGVEGRASHDVHDLRNMMLDLETNLRASEGKHRTTSTDIDAITARINSMLASGVGEQSGDESIRYNALRHDMKVATDALDLKVAAITERLNRNSDNSNLREAAEHNLGGSWGGCGLGGGDGNKEEKTRDERA